MFRDYERRNEERGSVDFEDLLAGAVGLFERDAGRARRRPGALSRVTVDEYQDVNLLQQTLLELWLGERDDLCAVGDDYQAIYAFTGATPRHLLELPARYPHATVVRLEANYRSTPEVLALANRLVPKLGGGRRRCGRARLRGLSPWRGRSRRLPTSSTSSSSGFAPCTRTASPLTGWRFSTG